MRTLHVYAPGADETGHLPQPTSSPAAARPAFAELLARWKIRS